MGFILNPYRYAGFDEDALIFYVKTDNSGTSNNDQFTIPVSGATYSYNIKTSDGQSFTGETAAKTITFPSIGNYYIEITGTFPRIFFNNGGDKLKLIKVLNFGSITYGTDQSNAFYGCSQLDEISSINGNFDFFNNTVNFTNAFWSTTKIFGLPEGITFGSLVTGTNMWRIASLQSYPSTVTFASLTSAFRMHESCELTTVPSGITFNLVTDARYMFWSNVITDFPSSVRFDSLTLGDTFFNSGDLNDTRYSQFLSDLDTYNPNNTVTLGMGNSAHAKNEVDSGTTDGTTANKLVDSTQNFTSTVSIGDAVRNTTLNTFALVTNVDSDTQLTLDNDIMAAHPQNYKIYDDSGTKAKANLIANRSWTITDATTY